MKKIHLKTFLLTVIISFTYFCLLLDIYKYSGFVKKYLFVDAKTILIFGVLMATIMFFTRNYKKVFVFRMHKIVFPVLLIFYTVIIYLEDIFYPNYVFSHLHIHPESFFPLVYFSGLMLLIGSLGYKLQISKKGGHTIFTINTLILLFLSYLLINGSFTIMNQAFSSDIFILAHMNYNYDDKMKQSWGFYYDYMKFVVVNSLSNSSVLIPSQNLSANSGNMGLTRYFLYPRKLTNANGENVTNANTYDYILLVRENDETIWPKVKISAENVILFDSTNMITTEMRGDYDPNKISSGLWGLIKIKK